MSGPAETRSDVDAKLHAELDALGDEIARTRRISARLGGHVEGSQQQQKPAVSAKVWRWGRRGLLFDVAEVEDDG